MKKGPSNGMQKKSKAKKKDYGKLALVLHKKLGGKIRTMPARPVKNREDLSTVYTPGVGFVSSYVAAHEKERDYTMKGRTIAIVSDGSAVLGLGNIGPYGAIPVMEGKAVLFKSLADLEAFPIVLDTQDPDEIVETVVRIAPMFGGINLEDIAAPKCFDIEKRVKAALDIPVMHDDQHGTAIVVVAGLINAAKVVRKQLSKMTVVVSGAGAAGMAVAKLLALAGVGDIIALDSKGIILKGRADLTPHKVELASFTNKTKRKGALAEALKGADAVIGVSGPGLMDASHVKLMAKGAIVFGLANPIPEILPEEAERGGAAVIATGRSDYPNQINNSLAFPGVFRGALDNRINEITDEMKLKAAKALAGLVKKPTAKNIVPGTFDKRVVPTIARAIR
jgi:malate dehydrogenase (oxaloacetate-decarboxylating)